jgi:uroporphyrinogen decarboxylase
MNYEVAVQGNLDPTLLFGDWELIEKRAKTLLDSIPNKPGYIFNLGHGILPKTPEENVRRLVNLVQGR